MKIHPNIHDTDSTSLHTDLPAPDSGSSTLPADQSAPAPGSSTLPAGHRPLRSNRLFLISGIILGLLAALLSLLARTLPGFGQFYALNVYPVFRETLGRFCSLFPFSLSEVGLYSFLLLCLIFLVRNIKRPFKLLSILIFTAGGLLLIFTLNCGINYYRNTFSQDSGILMKESSIQELYELCAWLADQANAAADQLESLESAPSLRELGETGRDSMAALGEEFPYLSGWYPYPKPLINSRLLSVQQLCGIYSPFTIEANYNREMPDYNIPHTICHELSHLKGFMREDEANFIGYLACIRSQSPTFRYSGYVMGWVYAGNALAAADPESFSRLYSSLNQRVKHDLDDNNQFWNRFEGKAAEVSNQINDRYLKAHSQEDGVQSYGRVVDLMLAYTKL